MIRSELILEVAKSNKLTYANADRVVSTVLDTIIKHLKAGKRIELRGFGVFSVRVRKPRKGRNPKTGASVQVAEKRVPFFRAGRSIKSALNKKGSEG